MPSGDWGLVGIAHHGRRGHSFHSPVCLQGGRILFEDLAGWHSWLEHRPVHQKVAGLIQVQGVCNRHPIDISHLKASLSFSFCVSLKSINIFSGEIFKKVLFEVCQIPLDSAVASMPVLEAPFHICLAKDWT